MIDTMMILQQFLPLTLKFVKKFSRLEERKNSFSIACCFV